MTRSSRVVLSLIALHSAILGVAMLFFPLRILEILGWEFAESSFFPAQSGLFLVILSIFYFASLRQPAYIPVVVVSKACAVVFLIIEASLGHGPSLIYLTAVGDAVMGAAAALVWKGERTVAG